MKVYLMLSDRFKNSKSLKGFQANEKRRFSILSANEHFQFKGEKLSSDFSVAVGLAMKQLYPDLDKLNFVEDEIPEKIKEQVEKRDAIHLACMAAATLLVLFLFAKSLHWHAGYQLEQVQQTSVQLEDKILAIENATEMLIAEREQIKQVQGLIRNRSQLAPGLHKIGKLTPENVWLEEVLVQNASASNNINVHGFSLTDLGIAKFMENLETDSGVKNVALKNAERIQSDQIYLKEKFQSSSLIRFELQFEFKNQ